MSELRWPKAYYVDAQGDRKSIRADELEDPKVFELARLNLLTDRYEQTRLFPRASTGENRAHFVASAQTGPRVYVRKENSRHDQRVTDLVSDLLLMRGPWRICFRQQEKHTEELLLPPYRWQPETTKIIGNGVVVRHDIFGASGALSDSRLRPEIAVEVVNTHYPEEVAFQAMLQESARRPYVVHFDHVRRPDRLLEFDAAGSQLFYEPNSFYIKDGEVFRGHMATGIRSALALQLQHDKMLDDWDRFIADLRANRVRA